VPWPSRRPISSPFNNQDSRFVTLISSFCATDYLSQCWMPPPGLFLVVRVARPRATSAPISRKWFQCSVWACPTCALFPSGVTLSGALLQVQSTPGPIRPLASCGLRAVFWPWRGPHGSHNGCVSSEAHVRPCEQMDVHMAYLTYLDAVPPQPAFPAKTSCLQRELSLNFGIGECLRFLFGSRSMFFPNMAYSAVIFTTSNFFFCGCQIGTRAPHSRAPVGAWQR